MAGVPSSLVKFQQLGVDLPLIIAQCILRRANNRVTSASMGILGPLFDVMSPQQSTEPLFISAQADHEPGETCLTFVIFVGTLLICLLPQHLTLLSR